MDDPTTELQFAEQLFARLVVRAGHASEQQVEARQRQIEASPEPTRLGRLLIAEGLLTRQQSRELLRIQGEVLRTLRTIRDRPEDLSTGELRLAAEALDQGRITDRELADALAIRALAPDEQTLLDTLQATPAGAQTREFGKFELTGLLGQGGMGRVYHAREKATGRELAIKVLPLARHADPQAVARFEKEARVLAGLAHPSLVQIVEVGRVGQRLYYSMPVLEGPTLRKSLSAEGALAPAQAVALLASLSRAVAAVHQAGLVHRDLKPDNVILTDPDTPVLIDFGIARRLDEQTRLTHTGKRVGTPEYMSPERIRGERTAEGPAADVWSLGVMLYEMLTGQRPFFGRTHGELLARIAQVQQVDVSRAAPGDLRLQAILRKALQPRPEQRYAGAAELALDLERYLRDEPPAAPPVSRWDWLARAGRRYRFAIGLTLATVLTLGVLLHRARLTERRLRAERENWIAAVRLDRDKARRTDQLAMAEALTALLAELDSTDQPPPRPRPGGSVSQTAAMLGLPAYREALERWEASLARAPEDPDAERRSEGKTRK